MSSYDLVILYELLMSKEELGFLQALVDNREDQATVNAYHDYLVDKGRLLSAKLILEKFVPTMGKPQYYIWTEGNSGSVCGSGATTGLASGQIDTPTMWGELISGSIVSGYVFPFNPINLSGLDPY